jgi:hypothetical protein
MRGDGKQEERRTKKAERRKETIPLSCQLQNFMSDYGRKDVLQRNQLEPDDVRTSCCSIANRPILSQR